MSWISDASANRLIQSYMKNFMDVSGNFKVRNTQSNITGYNITWSQIGSDIDGEAAGDWFGSSVSISSDGNTFVASGPFNDSNGNNAGHIRAYQWDGSSWNQLGSAIDGEFADDYFGYWVGAVAISGDGTTIAGGSYGNDDAAVNAGHVRVFRWNGSSWNQLGSDIDGVAAKDSLGISISLSDDGTIVAIGAGWSDITSNGKGHACIYQWDGTTWNQLGSNLLGEGADNRDYGYSVSLSSNGTIVAVGDRAYNGNEGEVRILQWDGTSWNQLGSSLFGGTIGSPTGLFGASVSLTDDGTMLAIGGNYHNNWQGVVAIFQWDGTSWNQVGQNILGEGDSWAGYSVSLSSDGTTVVIGSPKRSSYTGNVRVFKWREYTQTDEDNETYTYTRFYESSETSIMTENTSTAPIVGQYYWTQTGPNNYFSAEGYQGRHGQSVSLSSNGSRFVVGAPTNGGNGSSAGHVRVFSEVSEPIGTITNLIPLDVSGGTVNMLSSTTNVSSGVVDISGTTWMNRGQSGGTIADAYQKGLVIESNKTSADDAVLHIETAGQTQAFSVRADGAVYADNVLEHSSDDRRKINEQHITNASEILNKLSPQIYTKLNAFVENGGTPTNTESGLIAQEIYYNVPELRHLVYTEGNPQPYDLSGTTIENDPDYNALGWGPKSATVNYIGLIPYLIKASQEKQAILDEQEAIIAQQTTQVEELKTRLSSLESK
jgi:hypothetical protein